MGAVRQKRIQDMQESMDRLAKEYDVRTSKKAPAKKKKATKKASKKRDTFSVFGLAAKIKRRKAQNLKAATE